MRHSGTRSSARGLDPAAVRDHVALREETVLQIEQMKEAGDALRPIAEALSALVYGESSPEELIWFDRVEALRRDLEASNELIDVSLPYGSARPKLMQVSAVCKRRSKKPAWGRLLFHLVRQLQPEDVLELGTCLGISTAYLTAALTLNASGRLITIEGSRGLAAQAQRNLESLELWRATVRVGLFQTTLSSVLDEVHGFSLVFIDGHHDELATQAYFEQILPYLSAGAVVVFDDIAWSDGMRRAWDAISAHAAVAASIDVAGVLGISVLRRSPGQMEDFRLPVLYPIRGTPARDAREIADIIRRTVPESATILVVSRGDDALLDIDGRRGWHFPQHIDGSYAGYHPADSGEAIRHLLDLRAMGAEYVVFPSTAFWWRDYYADFWHYLDAGANTIWSDGRCVIYQLPHYVN